MGEELEVILAPLFECPRSGVSRLQGGQRESEIPETPKKGLWLRFFRYCGRIRSIGRIRPPVTSQGNQSRPSSPWRKFPRMTCAIRKQRFQTNLTTCPNDHAGWFLGEKKVIEWIGKLPYRVAWVILRSLHHRRDSRIREPEILREEVINFDPSSGPDVSIDLPRLGFNVRFPSREAGGDRSSVYAFTTLFLRVFRIPESSWQPCIPHFSEDRPGFNEITLWKSTRILHSMSSFFQPSHPDILSDIEREHSLVLSEFLSRQPLSMNLVSMVMDAKGFRFSITHFFSLLRVNLLFQREELLAFPRSTPDSFQRFRFYRSVLVRMSQRVPK